MTLRWFLTNRLRLQQQFGYAGSRNTKTGENEAVNISCVFSLASFLMTNKRVAIFGIIFVLFVGLSLWFFKTMIGYVDFPHSIKLVDCTNSTVQFHLRVPKGNTFALLLSLPTEKPDSKSPLKFSGRVYISDGTLATIEFPIDLKYSESCNWLKDSSSLILTGLFTNSPPLGQLIRVQKDYDFKIVFDEPPPVSTSIWLSWLQAVKDKGK